ncbi:MAG: murein hydrolase activator EnvC family protein [Caulobacteraceae bacterium]
MILRAGMILALAALVGGAALSAPRAAWASARESGRAAAERAELQQILEGLELLARQRPPGLLTDPADARAAVRAETLAAALEAELAQRARILAADIWAAEAKRGAAAGPSPSVRLTAPTGGAIVTPFGARLSDGSRSQGLEIGAASGAAVTSPAPGLVAFAGRLEGSREVVILKLAGQAHLVLSGLGAVTVVPGRTLAAGSVIGSMPEDAGPHPRLYLELRRGREPLDPAPMMGPPWR